METSTKTAIIFGGAAVATIGLLAWLESRASAKANAASPAGQMNAAIAANGLRKVDMPIYEAFQTSAGIGVDGFVGPTTAAALEAALAAEGAKISPKALRADGTPYPWLASTGDDNCSAYDGTNAPLASQWDPTGVC